MKWIEAVKQIIYANDFVSSHKADDEHRNQRGIALIAAAAFFVMSLLNVKQGSTLMLLTTLISTVFLLLGYWVSKYRNHSAFLRGVFYVIFVVIFTGYTVMGGNEGFAALWILVATYAVMGAIDFKAGFLISFYYLVMLVLIFPGPLTFVLQYDYDTTFMLRFPFLYAINFAFATYIVVRIRMYQYEILQKQQELERLGTVDLSTGLMNRNSFIQRERTGRFDHVESLQCVFIDVNGLHGVNNSSGHAAGDRMLSEIAQLCKKQFPHDSVYRMGGDEFLILCENSAEDEVAAAAHSLADAVVRAGYSISFGVAAQVGAFDLTALVKSADDRMMQCKRVYYGRDGQSERQIK